MSRALFLLLLVGSTGLAGFPANEPPAPRPGIAEAAGPVSPPTIDGPTEIVYWGVFRVANLPPEAGVDWTWPDGLKTEDVECECRTDEKGKVVPLAYEAKVRVSGPPGEYTVRAKLLRYNPVTRRAFTTNLPPKKFTIKGTPRPDPDPKPDPDPDPKPDPDPGPQAKVRAFVVVEDTLKAQQWRGDILGAPEVAAYYRTEKLVHRLIDVNLAGDGLDPTSKGWVDKAAGKELPWLFALDGAGKVVRSEKLKLDPKGFIAQLSGEAAHARAMGNLPPPENKVRGVFPKFGSSAQVPRIAREQWKEVNLEAFLPPVYDQDGVGACNAYASVTAFEASRKMAGLPYVAVSPGFLYGAINGGVDQGSFLEDGMRWMSEVGTVKSTTVAPLDWRRGRSLMNNAAARAEAKNYRAVEVYECPSFDHIASALQQGFFIVEGLMWYNNFNTDRDGWLPARGQGGAGGHALAGYGLAQRNGVWGIRTRNSWNTGWGAGGNCVIPETLFDNRIGGFWAVRAVTQTPDARVPSALDPFRPVYALAP